MKRNLPILIVLCVLCALATGCSDQETLQNESTAPDTQESRAAPDNEEMDETPQVDSRAAGGVDLDLTALSSTMVYAEVFSMMSHPDEYMGRTIKMNGPYYSSFYDETGLYYHYVVIEDATACCQQGIEFVWNGEHAYPGGYPDNQTRIEVTGTFGSYDELGKTYYCILADDLTFLD